MIRAGRPFALVLTLCAVGSVSHLEARTHTPGGDATRPASASATTPASAPRLLRPDDIFNLKDVGDPQLSADGQWLAYTVKSLDAKADKSRTRLWMLPLGGGPALPLSAEEHSASHPRFSPDGRYVAFLSSRADQPKQVYLLDRRGGEAQRLTQYKGDVSDCVWSPDSTRLALVVSDPDPEAQDDEQERAPDADTPKAESSKPPKPIVITRLQFKRDGEGYLRELREHLHVFELATRNSVQVTSGPYDDSEPVWSPDGRHLAFTSNRTADPDSNQNQDIFLVAARAAQTPRALTSSPGTDHAPDFAPDGRHVAYVAGGDPKDMWYGTERLGWVDVAGGSSRLLTADLDRNVQRPRVAPDGRTVYFLLEDAGNVHLARVPVAGGPFERVLAGEREVRAYDLVAGAPSGTGAAKAAPVVVVSETRPQQPAELSLVNADRTLRRLTTVNDEFVRSLRLAPVERFQARSADGTPVDVFLTRPPDLAPGTRAPAILRIHGGPTSQYSTEFELEWQMLAAHGYVVVAANPRGSTGYGQAFSRALWADWGNPDYQDVMAAVDAAIARGVADPERLGVGGWSYGGILTNYVITKTERFRAAISGASEANYLANYGTDHYQYEWETELGLPWRNTALWLRLSPWFQIERVKTPTLVLCGEDDMNVPLLNSEQLYQALRRLGVETELVIYPGENHSIDRPSFRKDRFERYLAWYDKYLRR